MAELVDATDSKSVGVIPMWVRVPPQVPHFRKGKLKMDSNNKTVSVIKADNGYVIEYWNKETDARTILICKNIREVGKTLTALFEGSE